MNKIIDLKNLNYSYKSYQVLFDISITVNEGEIVTILGSPSGGKTTIVNYIKSLNKKNITIYDKDKKYLYEQIIKKIYSNKKEAEEKISKIYKYFKLINTKNEEYINIIGSLLTNKVIVFDNSLLDLNKAEKNLLYNYAKKNNYTIINVTNDINDTLFGDKIIVLDKGKIIMEGKTLSVLNEERILRRLGFHIPFIIDLSKQLLYYNMVNKLYTSYEDLAGDLWG